MAPAIYGGIQLGIHTGERWMTERVNTPPGIQVGGQATGGGGTWGEMGWREDRGRGTQRMTRYKQEKCQGLMVWLLLPVCGVQLVLFIPDFIGKTSDARAVLQVRQAGRPRTGDSYDRQGCLCRPRRQRVKPWLPCPSSCTDHLPACLAWPPSLPACLWCLCGRPRWTARTPSSTSAVPPGWSTRWPPPTSTTSSGVRASLG